MDSLHSLPGYVAWIGRASAAALVFVMCAWVFQDLGGLAMTPKVTGPASNDTGPVFNWHPLFMSLAFPLLMGEALLAYRSPLLDISSRPRRKIMHATLMGTAGVLVILSVVAAVMSHTLKQPTPIPNLYSAHSWLGVTTLAAMTAQIAMGVGAYLIPGWTQAAKKNLRPKHVFLGLAVYVMGLATMATGLQEKATFLQLIAKANVRSSAMLLPALMVVLLAVTGCLYMMHFIAGSAQGSPPPLADQDVLSRRESAADNGI